MTSTTDTLCEHIKLRLIAAAVGLQQCTKTDGTEVLIPGTDKRILIGGDAYLAKVALPPVSAAEQPLWDDNGEPWNEAAEKVEQARQTARQASTGSAA